jgi:hypothetical protein
MDWQFPTRQTLLEKSGHDQSGARLRFFIPPFYARRTAMPTHSSPPTGQPKSRLHRFSIGQKVRMRNTVGLSLRDETIFRILATLPILDGSPQYRIRTEGDTYERVTTEDNLEDAKG